MAALHKSFRQSKHSIVSRTSIESINFEGSVSSINRLPSQPTESTGKTLTKMLMRSKSGSGSQGYLLFKFSRLILIVFCSKFDASRSKSWSYNKINKTVLYINATLVGDSENKTFDVYDSEGSLPATPTFHPPPPPFKSNNSAR